MIDSTPTLGFVLDAEHEAHQPPEVAGGRRDRVRLLVSTGHALPVHARFDAIGDFLRPGDLLVVNTSATIPAAVDGRLPDGDPVVVHFSGELPGGVLLVEVRQPDSGTTTPRFLSDPVELDLLGLGRVRLHARYDGSRRLWLASGTFEDGASLGAFLDLHGRPIRYRHVPREWPIEAYQTVFAREPGSVEMPSAARPFSTELVTDLVGRGIAIAPLVLHTGVSSLEAHEAPYAEYFRVPAQTAHLVNDTHRQGGRAGVGTKSKKGPWVWPVEKSLTAIEGSSGRTNNLRCDQRGGDHCLVNVLSLAARKILRGVSESVADGARQSAHRSNCSQRNQDEQQAVFHKILAFVFLPQTLQ